MPTPPSPPRKSSLLEDWSKTGLLIPQLSRVQRFLLEHGIPQNHFAAKCGMSAEHLSRLLNQRCGLGELSEIKLARGLQHFQEATVQKGDQTPIPQAIDGQMKGGIRG